MDLVTMLGLHRTQVQSSCLSGGLDLAAQLGRWLPPGRGDCANGPEAGLTPIFPLLPTHAHTARDRDKTPGPFCKGRHSPWPWWYPSFHPEAQGLSTGFRGPLVQPAYWTEEDEKPGKAVGIQNHSIH